MKEYSGWVLDNNCKNISLYTQMFHSNRLFCIHFHILNISNSHTFVSVTYTSSRIEKK